MVRYDGVLRCMITKCSGFLEQKCLEGSGELTPHFGDTLAHFRRTFALPYTTSKTATHTTPNH